MRSVQNTTTVNWEIVRSCKTRGVNLNPRKHWSRISLKLRSHNYTSLVFPKIIDDLGRNLEIPQRYRSNANTRGLLCHSFQNQILLTNITDSAGNEVAIENRDRMTIRKSRII